VLSRKQPCTLYVVPLGVVKSGTIEALLGYDDCELEVEVDEKIIVLWAALGREELPTALGSDEEVVGVSELEVYPDELWEALGSDDDCAADDDVPCEFVVLWAALDDVEPSDDEAVRLSEDSDEL
jgi:hypothetical protein